MKRKKTNNEIIESKIWESYQKATIKCRCSNRVPLSTMNEEGYSVCRWCGERVYKEQSQQLKYEFKKKLNQQMRRFRVYNLEDLTFGELVDMENKIVKFDFEDRFVEVKE